MLDALKSAFELMLVGALALPWIALLFQAFNENASWEDTAYLKVLPRDVKKTVALILVIAGGYVAGSVVSRLASNLLNDEMLGRLPTEDNIRDSIYQEKYCKPVCDPAKEKYCSPSIVSMNAGLPDKDELTENDKQYLDKDIEKQLEDRFRLEDIERADVWRRRNMLRRYFCPLPGIAQEENDRRRDHLNQMFFLQEAQVLLDGDDKTDRLKQYHDQLVVLRGAIFNGVTLTVLSLFCWCAGLRENLAKRGKWRLLAYLPAGSLTVYAVDRLLHHVLDHLSGAPTGWYTDPPMVEILLLLFGVFGLVLTSGAKAARSYATACVLSLVITLACYGGWWWTEDLYDSQVLHTQPELHTAQKTVEMQSNGK